MRGNFAFLFFAFMVFAGCRATGNKSQLLGETSHQKESQDHKFYICSTDGVPGSYNALLESALDRMQRTNVKISAKVSFPSSDIATVQTNFSKIQRELWPKGENEIVYLKKTPIGFKDKLVDKLLGQSDHRYENREKNGAYVTFLILRVQPNRSGNNFLIRLQGYTLLERNLNNDDDPGLTGNPGLTLSCK